MRIFINAYEANVSQRVGSNEYAFRVLWELYELSRSDMVTVILPTQALADLPPARPGWNYMILGTAPFWSITRLSTTLWKIWMTQDKADLVISLGHYAPIFPPFPSVVCVMDLAYLEVPKNFRFSDRMKLKYFTDYSIKQSRELITISQSTKTQILRWYPTYKGQITVAYPGINSPDPLKKNQDSFQDLQEHFPQLSDQYLLFVGTLQPRKNLPRLIQAFELIAEDYPNLQLVLAGKEGWLVDETLTAIAAAKHNDRILRVGFVSQQEKLNLMRFARAEILVGLHEGFGIPPLESLQQGTPVIVANHASLPEVVGEAGVIVDPFEPIDIARGLREVLDWSAKDLSRFRQKASEQIQHFDWEQSGRIIYSRLSIIAGRSL